MDSDIYNLLGPFSASISMFQDRSPIIYPHKQEIRDKNLLLSLQFAPFFLTIATSPTKKTKRPTTIVSRPFNDVNKINILPFELVGIRALIQSYKRSGLLKILILLLLLLP